LNKIEKQKTHCTSFGLFSTKTTAVGVRVCTVFFSHSVTGYVAIHFCDHIKTAGLKC